MIHGERVARGAPAVTHLFFDDDCFLFFKANQQEACLVKDMLAIYGRASGQMVNFNKSSISFSANVSATVVSQICGILDVNGTTNHGAYLGLLSFVGRRKKDVFSFIRDKVWKRLQGWNKRML